MSDHTEPQPAAAATRGRGGVSEPSIPAAHAVLLGLVQGADTNEWRQMINVNLLGLLYCTNAAVPVIRDGGGGDIVNVASVAGRVARMGSAVYNMTKWGVVGFSEGLRQRIWWGSASNATGEWAAKLGMHLMSSTLKFDESGKPLHEQQSEQIRLYREAWVAAGHAGEPRVSVSRSIFPIVSDQDRAYFGHNQQDRDTFGYIEPEVLAVFGRSYAAEPDVLVEQLKADEAIAEADTLLLTVPNQLGVDYNAHVIEAILKHVAPGLGWR